MRITHIQLKNWKNFLDADVPLEERVFLIGPNAAGKSNFLDAMRFMRDIAMDGLEKAVAYRGGMKSIRCLGARKEPNVFLGFHIDDWRYELELTQDDKEKTPLVHREVVYEGDKTRLERPLEEDRADPKRLTQTALQQVGANQDFRDIADFFKTITYRHILPQAMRDPQGFSPTPVNNDPFGRDLVRQIWNTSSRTRESRLTRMSGALQLAVPNLSELKSDMDKASGVPHLKAKYKHWRANGAIQNEMAFSDGTLRLLAMLWTILEKGGPLLLEEPELSLHEEVVKQLPAMFARLVRGTARRQVIISTHSYALLSDPGIPPSAILLLKPTERGTVIEQPELVDVEMMEEGLSAADVMLPKTRPENIEQLSLFKL